MDVVPTETIYDIAKLLVGDFNSLYSLSVVSTRFHVPANTFLYESVSDASLPTLIMENDSPSLTSPVHHVLNLSATGSKTSASLFTKCLDTLQKHRGTKSLQSLHLDFPSEQLENLFPEGSPPILHRLQSLSIRCTSFKWRLCYSTISALWCPTLTHLNLNFCDLFHPPSYANLAECFTAMPSAVPALSSLHIGLPACYTPAHLPELRRVFNGTPFTFAHLTELDIKCSENSIAFESFLLRHPNVSTLGISIPGAETTEIFDPDLQPLLLLRSNPSRPIKSLTLRTQSLTQEMFVHLIQVLRFAVTVQQLEIETKGGLLLGHIRAIVAERPYLLRFYCNVNSDKTDDESPVVTALYDVVLNNLPHLREFCTRFQHNKDAQFLLHHKLAIRSAFDDVVPSRTFPVVVKVYVASDVLPALIFDDNRFW
ncbi:hypothetical protein GG344DRAFT_74014 [Lentinula edodes]|nr:hypothetical protein GG344DRAFT_74014 [Lentinula edodes]